MKPEEDSEHVKTKSQMPSAGVKGKYSLFTEEEVHPLKHLIPAEVSNQVKAAVAEEVAVHEEELQTKQRSPITILSDDEGYLLEEDQPIAKAEDKAETFREFSTSEIKTVKPNRKKKKLEMIAPY